MRRILIFSDTHGYIEPCIRLMSNMPGVNAVIHSGDCARDAADLKRMFPDIPVHFVRGNNDFLNGAPNSLTLTEDGKRIFVTHGHLLGVKYDLSLSNLKEAGEKAGADLVVYGHTHIPNTEYFGKMIILNPGSVRYSRTYAVAEIEDGVLKTAVVDLP